ncbi:hypothetical protein ASE04_20580 [Rhizobium sp. Root708]|uniref:hypothetical protein n=1 Tax=Rhizobium sp. Root708 TaxID=1736592 RepID=UPI0006F6E67C|nr:hypothetical protein [Rhizobium sp. Root708]KRB61906.1 hypothetical protein ASE04_20580 [Rhizobium sp. Root708]
MADFIAVIRRAVDGLTDNTPEMRVKVYERARGAVQRQLENMKPRPPEAMLQRQLEKLETAIREVEAEHAVALPADDSVVEEEVVVAAAEAVDEEPAGVAEPEPQAEEPEALVAATPVEEPEAPVEAAPAEEPVYHEPVYEQSVETEEPVVSSEPAYPAEPVYEEPTHHAEDARYDEPEETVREAAAQHDAAWQSQEHQPEPVAVSEEAEAFEPWQATHEEEAPLEAYEPAAEPHEVAVEHQAALEEYVPEELAPAVEPYEAPVEPVSQPARDFDLSNRLVEPVYAFDKEPEAFVQHSREEPLHTEGAAHFDPVWAEHAEEVPEPVSRSEPTDWALEELRQFSDSAHPAPANDAARAFDDLVAGLGNAAVQPAASTSGNEAFSWEAAAFDDLPPIESNKKPTVTANFDDGDLFSEVHGGQSQKPENPDDSWQEATQLRGYNNRGVVAEDDDGTAQNDIDSVIASKFQGRNLRMEPKRRRFGIGSIIGLLIALGVVGGGAYAAWTHQDALTEMVKGLVSAAPSQTVKTETQTPAQPNTPASAPQNVDAGATKPAEAQKEVASLNDGSSVSNKFTQRLLADGTEVDNGAAAIPSAQAAEGKSVAPQNVASSDATPPATATTPATTGTAPATAAAAPDAQQAAPVGSSEKMFLYEERIGQSSPTAIQGSVAWTVKHEPGADGKQEAIVQGTITVPERNLTAQVNFKRNSDPSLPASHIVEVVFSLPANFEGGAIESVQRIAMKRTEQDRGDPLIAVPAKITDDFHMIALNDYPDARKANLDLLENRDWIDIPITYRNGRRALITMQKGATGGQAFTSAIKEWAASGDVSTSQ